MYKYPYKIHTHTQRLCEDRGRRRGSNDVPISQGMQADATSLKGKEWIFPEGVQFYQLSDNKLSDTNFELLVSRAMRE